MSLIPGEDTYVTLEDANAYFDNRLHSDTWTAANSADREKALRAATTLVDLCDFRGQRTSDVQPLSWPRRYVIDSEGRMQASDIMPPGVKHAVYEMAIYVLRNDATQENNANIIRRVVGDLEIEYSASQPDNLPTYVRRLLTPYLLDGANTARLIP